MNQGMIVDTLIYRSGRDCTNDGLTKYHDDFLLIGDKIPKIFDENDRTVLILKSKTSSLWNGEYLYAEPNFKPKGNGWMFGGNYVTSCDSRLPQRVIPVHDRQEYKDMGGN